MICFALCTPAYSIVNIIHATKKAEGKDVREEHTLSYLVNLHSTYYSNAVNHHLARLVGVE